MEKWEHYCMGWCYISPSLAINNIKDNSIVKCEINEKKYLFNIPDEENIDITSDMIKLGKWYGYTWKN